jgi:hypothetical protein
MGKQSNRVRLQTSLAQASAWFIIKRLVAIFVFGPTIAGNRQTAYCPCDQRARETQIGARLPTTRMFATTVALVRYSQQLECICGHPVIVVPSQPVAAAALHSWITQPAFQSDSLVAQV